MCLERWCVRSPHEYQAVLITKIPLIFLSILSTSYKRSARDCDLMRHTSKKSMISLASHGSKISSRIAVSSSARRSRLGSGTGPRARRSATPILSGPSRKRPCFFSGPIPPAKSTWLNWRKNTGRAKPWPSWARSSAVTSITCYSAKPRSLWASFSTAKGAERMSRTPHWTTTGSACVSCSARRISLCHCVFCCVIERVGAHRPFCSDPLAFDWTFALAPVYGR